MFENKTDNNTKLYVAAQQSHYLAMRMGPTGSGRLSLMTQHPHLIIVQCQLLVADP